MHKSLQRIAMLREGLLIMIESPSEKFFDVVSNVQLNFLSWQSQPGIYLFEDETKLNLELFP